MEKIESIAERVRALHRRLQLDKPTDNSASPDSTTRVVECMVCGDEGVIVDWARNVARPCSCVEKRMVQRLIRSSRIGDEFRSKTFENFVIEGKDERVVKAAKMATQYVRTFDQSRHSARNSFAVCGAVGSGKTHLAVAVANRLLQRGVEVRYFNFVTGFKEMLARYDDGGSAVEEVRHDLQTCEVLLLDDVAKGKPDRRTKLPSISDAVFSELYSIVEHRYFHRLPLLWTSELREDLIDVIGEATASRLFQMSDIAEIAYLDGEAPTTLNHRLEVTP